MYEAQSFAVLKNVTTATPCEISYDWWLMLFMSPRDMRVQAHKQEKAQARGHVEIPTGEWVVKSDTPPLTEETLIEYHGKHGSHIGHVAGVRISEEYSEMFEEYLMRYEILLVPQGTEDLQQVRDSQPQRWLPLSEAYNAHMLHHEAK